MVNWKYTTSETDGKDKWEMSHLWSTLKSNRCRMHILCPLLRLIKHNAGISHSSPSRYSILQPKLSPDTSLPSPQDYLNTGQVQDLWKDADFIRVCNKCMKQLAVCHCCGNCFQFVTTEIQLFQVLQLTEFAERETKEYYTYRQELVTFWTSLPSSQSTAPQKNSWYYVVFILERQCDILVKRSR